MHFMTLGWFNYYNSKASYLIKSLVCSSFYRFVLQIFITCYSPEGLCVIKKVVEFPVRANGSGSS